MSHEIETMFYNEQNGKPWHELGTAVNGLLTSGEAIKFAGLDWEVVQKPLFVGDANGTGFDQVPDQYVANVRSTDNKVLGVVGTRYKIIQNSDCFKVVDELTCGDVPQAVYETAGSLRGGKQIWMLARLPHIKGMDVDPVELYLVLTNSHDGSKQVQACITAVRVVCNNTLNMAIKGSKNLVQVRHNAKAEKNLVAAREILKASHEYYKALCDCMDYLKTKQMTARQQVEFVTNLIAGPEKIKTPLTDAIVKETVDQGNLLNAIIMETTAQVEVAKERELPTRTKNIIDEIIKLTETGKGVDLPGVRGTAYGVMQAVSEYADHKMVVRGEEKNPENRLESIWFGSSKDLKQEAFDQLLDWSNVGQVTARVN